MHYSEVYADERAREMEAVAQRRMGCWPLCGMFSRVIKKCNGHEGRTRNERMDYAMAYPTAARTVTVATTNHHHVNAHAIPPEPSQTHTTLPGTPFVAAAAAPPARAGGKPRKKKKSKRVRFTPAGPVPAGPAPPPNVAHAQQDVAAGTSSAAASGHHDHPAGAEPYSPAAHGYGRYAPSPLTRWEMLGAAGTPRRYEYFSGEYRWCYPTSASDGICCITTDANRLTTIFSEENPNACTIV